MNLELERWLDAIEFTGRLALDGSVQRYGRKGNKWVWSIAKGDDTFVVAGDWATGEKTQFGTQTIAIKRELRVHSNERDVAAAAAAETARVTWGLLSDKPRGRTYLERKGVVALGVKFKGCLMYVPMRRAGQMVGLQQIDPAGEKRFTLGCKKLGSSHRIHGTGGAILCEGYATGASIHMATGRPVVIAFDCGNLPHAARYYDDISLIAADNDATAGNPGLTKATELAHALDVALTFPPMGMDFNDVHALHGLDSIKGYFA
jgi:putative DNA primase/helicase